MYAFLVPQGVIIHSLSKNRYYSVTAAKARKKAPPPQPTLGVQHTDGLLEESSEEEGDEPVPRPLPRNYKPKSSDIDWCDQFLEARRVQ